mgnify:CR=1 FL=1
MEKTNRKNQIKKKILTGDSIFYFSKTEIINMATERAKEMSTGNEIQDKECIYNYAQGMIEMQYRLLKEI